MGFPFRANLVSSVGTTPSGQLSQVIVSCKGLSLFTFCPFRRQLPLEASQLQIGTKRKFYFSRRSQAYLEQAIDRPGQMNVKNVSGEVNRTTCSYLRNVICFLLSLFPGQLHLSYVRYKSSRHRNHFARYYTTFALI